MNLPPIDRADLLEFLTGLLQTPSPTGYTAAAVAYCEAALSGLPGWEMRRTRKGALLLSHPGSGAGSGRAVTAHLDTLGAVVKEVKKNGRLRLSPIGGYAWNTIENEGCTIYLASGSTLRGSVLLDFASGHVYGAKVNETQRNPDNMEVRLDADTTSKEETLALGVQTGDFVAIDPRAEVNQGYIRSRHLDDKAGVAAVVAALRALAGAGLAPARPTQVLFSNYEEVGHGGAVSFGADTAELLVVDMAAVGEGQSSTERHATLCVKDSSGPYHHELSCALRALAGQHGIDYRADIYPYYSSDGSAHWRAGNDLAVALIGPGVDASHSYERTHIDAVADTARWVAAYLLS